MFNTRPGLSEGLPGMVRRKRLLSRYGLFFALAALLVVALAACGGDTQVAAAPVPTPTLAAIPKAAPEPTAPAAVAVTDAATPAPVAEDAVDIARVPTDLPAPVGDRAPAQIDLNLEAVELNGNLADGVTYKYWTFNKRVPGPLLRVRVDDTVNVTLKNLPGNFMIHSVDLHAVTGPGGGAAVMQVPPGEEASFSFKALKPGLYVYHCATPSVGQHIANGMYGMILVEPAGGLPAVDREFYVMQGDMYTQAGFGAKGNQVFDRQKMLNEEPDYFVLNGAVGALTTDHPLKASVGETIRILFGVGGPNFISSFHIIGEAFDRVYENGSLTTPPQTDVQTTLVPPGGASMVELKLQYPGRYLLVDHAISRLERGLLGFLEVDGEADPAIFNPGG